MKRKSEGSGQKPFKKAEKPFKQHKKAAETGGKLGRPEAKKSSF